MCGRLKAFPLAWDRGDGYGRCPENGNEEQRTGIAKVQAGLLLDQQLCAIVAGFEAWRLGDIHLVALVVSSVQRMARRCAMSMRGLDRFGCDDMGMDFMRFQYACIGNS